MVAEPLPGAGKASAAPARTAPATSPGPDETPELEASLRQGVVLDEAVEAVKGLTTVDLDLLADAAAVDGLTPCEFVAAAIGRAVDEAFRWQRDQAVEARRRRAAGEEP